MPQTYIPPNIRKLLTEGFSDQELLNFCFDNEPFRPLYYELGQNSGKGIIVSKLLDFAYRINKIGEILEWAEKTNPAKYLEFEPYFRETSTPQPPVIQETDNVPPTPPLSRLLQRISVKLQQWISVVMIIGGLALLSFGTKMFFDYQSITEIRSAAFTSTAAAQSTAIANRILSFKDDFSSNNNGWKEGIISNQDTDQEKRVVESVYRVRIKSRSDQDLIIRQQMPDFSAKDFEFSFRAKIVEPSDKVDLAILFRLNDETDDHYRIQFDQEGTYFVEVSQNNNRRKIVVPTSGIKLNQQDFNKFRVQVFGSHITIYVNDQLLNSVNDSTLSEAGIIDLAVQLPAKQNVTIDFDDVEITEFVSDSLRDKTITAATARAIAPMETVVAQSTAIANPVTVFKEDFSPNSNGLEPINLPEESIDAEYQIIDGKYRVKATSKKSGWWVRLKIPAARPKDFLLKFNATLVEASDLAGISDDFGVSILFRKEGNNYYYVRFGSKSSYRVDLRQNSESQPLIEPSTLSSTLRLERGVPISFTVRAIGSEIIIYANDQELARATDSTLSQAGNIELAVELPEKQNVTIDFDDVEITEFVLDDLRDKIITAATARAIAPTVTAVAQSTAIANGVIVFEDDFETNEHDWSQGLEEDENGTVVNEITSQGKYQSRVQSEKSKYVPHWIPNIPLLKDFQLSVEATVVEAPDPISSAKIVLEFRKNKENGYWVEFNGDGSYKVYRKQNEFELIQENTTSDVFTLKEGITNTFEILEIGSTFTVFVNDKKLTTLPSIVANEFNTFSFGSQLAKANDILTINFDHLVIKEVSIDITKPQLEASVTARANATALAQIAPTITAVVRATALADAVANTGFLFQDDFSSNTNNWFVGNDADNYATIKNQFVGDNYRRSMTSKKSVFWPSLVPKFSAKDFWLRVKTTLVETSGEAGDADISIIFRKNVDGDYYRATFKNNSTFKVFRWEQATKEWITLQDFTYSEAIKLDFGYTNTFDVLAKGSSFTIYANNHELTTIKDVTLGDAGEIGLGIGLAEANQTLTVDFDELIVKEAP